jgi:N6-L-threonylcarbamoyladenine synthase
MERLAVDMGVDIHIPSSLLCSDNAAMNAVPGDFYLVNGIFSGFAFDALPVWPLDRVSDRFRAGGGV